MTRLERRVLKITRATDLMSTYPMGSLEWCRYRMKQILLIQMTENVPDYWSKLKDYL